MTEYGTVIDKRNLATAQSVSTVNKRVSNLSKTTDDVKDIAESALKVATIEYAIGTETEVTGEWQALTPKPNAGEYVWQRVTVTTGAGKTTQTTSLIQNIAALAQSTADTAKKDAASAQTAAEAAQSTADTAKSTAEATAQHFWTDDEGAHVTTTEQGETISGGNTLITNEGMEVKDGDTTLASFKKGGAVIGANNTQKIRITDKDFEAANADGKIAARISSEYGMEVNTETEYLSDPSMTGTLVLSFAPVARTVITVSDNGSSVTFTQGKAETKTMTTEFGTYTITYDGDRTFTGAFSAKFTYKSSQANGKVLSLADGAIYAKWNGEFSARKVNSRDFYASRSITAKGNITADGSIVMNGNDIKNLFSGVISIGTKDKDMSIAAGGNTGESTINLSKAGYSARCICGWNLTGTGSSYCVVTKLFINQTEQKIHYYVRNTGSSKATLTLRTYVLYTKNN